MTKSRVVFFVLLSAVIGYMSHDFINDNVVKLNNRIQILSNKSTADSVLGQTSEDPFITNIIYDGKSFHPDRVSIKLGNYLALTNQSKSSLMWISSDITGVTTTRGYAEGEQIRVIVYKAGEFIIQDTHNMQKSVRVHVVE